ncbi:hypothetical protein F5Y00DRAFT_99548 [Daldinia vernicosa]|uniref:uncharacterized protein n=1 Tax=Daldinia vernicosa TaxID=114800 RepID=UPI002007E156|nr:uncharacterized protein F5Y00DRAFT_99548 [Daldinia vernicosa]KAI0853340.1 hypothetical protein F5Y00DRAFT_99548 [Daldinia vernicosa]
MDLRSHDAPASSSSLPSGLLLRSSRTNSPLHDSHRPAFKMTEPPSEQPPMADTYDDQDHEPHPFAPIFTLVNNASTRTTHHPHVRYIFSDDDPDILTQALAELDVGVDGTASDPASSNRAMVLDLAPDPTGGYSVAWASSLSPSWAVLDAQLSQIAAPSSDAESNSGNGGGDGSSRPGRLMLKIEGIESNSLGSEGGLSGEASRHGSGSGSGSGSGQHDRGRGEIEDYTNLVDKFDRQMTTLRKIVDASEERQRKTAADTYAMMEPTQEVAGGLQPTD